MRILQFFKRFLSTSWLFALFLVIPGILVSQRILHLPLIDPKYVLYNIILFVVFLSSTLGIRFYRLFKPIRYGDIKPFFLRATVIPEDPATVRKVLEGQGYVFTSDGAYAEQRDWGYAGSLFFFAGLIILLAVGSYDNLRQFSGTILLGVGQPSKLYDKRSYADIVKGPVTDFEQIPFQIQVKHQVVYTPEAPDGHADITLLDRDGTMVKTATIAPEKPVDINGFRIHMARYQIHVWVVVTTSKTEIIFTDWLKMRRDAESRDINRYYATFQDNFGKLEGRAWYMPEAERLKLELKGKEGDPVAIALGMGYEWKKEAGGYIASMPGVGIWSEIHIVRKRHTAFLAAGAAIVILGSALRLWHRPKRVWIEVRSGHCILAATDSKAPRLYTVNG